MCQLDADPSNNNSLGRVNQVQAGMEFQLLQFDAV